MFFQKLSKTFPNITKKCLNISRNPRNVPYLCLKMDRFWRLRRNFWISFYLLTYSHRACEDSWGRSEKAPRCYRHPPFWEIVDFSSACINIELLQYIQFKRESQNHFVSGIELSSQENTGISQKSNEYFLIFVNPKTYSDICEKA